MPETHSHHSHAPAQQRMSWLLHSGASRVGVALLVCAAVFAAMAWAIALEG